MKTKQQMLERRARYMAKRMEQCINKREKLQHLRKTIHNIKTGRLFNVAALCCPMICYHLPYKLHGCTYLFGLPNKGSARRCGCGLISSKQITEKQAIEGLEAVLRELKNANYGQD